MKIFVGFEVLTPVVMKSSVFWDITPCSPLKVNRREEYVSSVFRAEELRETRNQRGKQSFLLGFYFDPENGDDMILRNVS
jgi:hypothetical protein